MIFMYAMIGKLTAKAGNRDQFNEILLRASKRVSDHPGCRAYLVLEDVQDEAAMQVFEVWDDRDSHDASLKDEAVRALIAEAMPILGGAPSGSELRLTGGLGTDLFEP